jgi:hypothetical protein
LISIEYSLDFRFTYRESAIDNTSAVQIFENNVICTQNNRPQIFKFTNCFNASATNVNQTNSKFPIHGFFSLFRKTFMTEWFDQLFLRLYKVLNTEEKKIFNSMIIFIHLGYNTTVLAYGQTASGNII